MLLRMIFATETAGRRRMTRMCHVVRSSGVQIRQIERLKGGRLSEALMLYTGWSKHSVHRAMMVLAPMLHHSSCILSSLVDRTVAIDSPGTSACASGEQKLTFSRWTLWRDVSVPPRNKECTAQSQCTSSAIVREPKGPEPPQAIIRALPTKRALLPSLKNLAKHRRTMAYYSHRVPAVDEQQPDAGQENTADYTSVGLQISDSDPHWCLAGDESAWLLVRGHRHMHWWPVARPWQPGETPTTLTTPAPLH